MPLAWVKFLNRDRWGRPVDPGYGVEGPEIDYPEYPDTGLPPGRPGHGLPPFLPPFPDRPSHPWLPGRPGMPGWTPEQGLPGVPEPPIELPPEGGIGQLPIFPDKPDHPIALPPGAVWPPLGGLKGKLLLLAWAPGFGFRWVVVDASAVTPPAGGIPGRPPERPEPRR